MIYIHFNGKQAFISKIEDIAELIHGEQTDTANKVFSDADQIELIIDDRCPAITTARKDALCVTILLDGNETKEKGAALKRIIENSLKPANKPDDSKIGSNTDLFVMVFQSA
jgi:hypothetical protein